MNARFRQILNLALRPETGEGEAAAALAAARRMVVKEGIDTMLSLETVVKEKERIVYRDVYRDSSKLDPYSQSKLSVDLKVSAVHLHATLETAFNGARVHKLILVIISATTVNKTIHGETHIKLDVYGQTKNANEWIAFMKRVIAHNNSKKTQHNSSTNKTKGTVNKEAGFWTRKFWSKLFGQ